MKKMLLLIPIVLQAALGSAQLLGWAKGLGAGASAFVEGVATDASGNQFSTGYFAGTGDFDPGPGVYNLSTVGNTASAFVVKLDANGNFAWAKNFPSTVFSHGLSMTADAAGNSYIIGQFHDTVDCDPGPGQAKLVTQNLGSSYETEFFIVKLDPSGNFVWARHRQSPNMEPHIHEGDIEVDASSNVYMTYSFGPTTGYAYSILIEKLNPQGNTEWITSIDTTGDPTMNPVFFFNSLALDGSGNVIVAGSFVGEIRVEPTAMHNVTAPNEQDVFVLKLNNAGSFVWVKTLTSDPSGFLACQDVAANASGNIVIGGRIKGTADFDPNAGIQKYTAVSYDDAYIAKLTSAGSLDWMRPYGLIGVNSTNAVTIDAAGTVYGTGWFDDSCSFGTPPNAVTLVDNNVQGSREGFIVKLTSNGSLGWVRQMGGGLGSATIGNDVTIGSNGMVYVGGRFLGQANFNVPGPAHILTAPGGFENGFVMAAESCSAIDTSLTLSGATLSANATGASYQWINCTTNTAVAGATSKTFTATATGNYAVVLTKAGCSDTSACRPLVGTDIGDLEPSLAAIYPNPTSGDISIVLNKSYSNVELVITSAIGAILSKTTYPTTHTINTSVAGAPGVYFINIIADGIVLAHEKVVKAD